MHWTPEGAIFPVQPGWAEGAFWAPELVEDRGRFLVYYVAKRRGGALAIAVATASAPQGPWVDHGPILEEVVGVIDPAFARDEHGKPYLIWKTDGNSVGEATPIWAQPLSGDLLHLTGDKTELIRNDQAWEEGVVEGPYILRHAHRFYLFYAGNACCGRECRYAEGVARADRLLGPWEKMAGNPLIGANDRWRCPGHGTAVHGSTMHGKKGQDYLLYHAYPASGAVYVGREAVLDEIRWQADGWPVVNAGAGPASDPGDAKIDFADDFGMEVLGPSWQWPVNTRPTVRTGSPGLCLRIPAHRQSAMVAVPIPGSPQFQAGVVMTAGREFDGEDRPQPESPRYNDPPVTTWAGLTVVGDPFNTIGLGLREDVLELWRRRGDRAEVVWTERLEGVPERVWLRVRSFDEAQLQFSFSVDGARWKNAGGVVDASRLPAWDRGLRLGLMLDGPGQAAMGFQDFVLRSAES